jgi:phosphatidylserine/phosphatidylglycerophosphate/cardiolipin synthase-like enzyme
MELIVQPGAGTTPVVNAIKHAKKTVDVFIFRMDRKEIFAALAAAVQRGVNVRALIAHTNRGGERGLRKLELRLLEAGVTVSRTADDLVRYHGKAMIVDRRVLHVFGFNFTGVDLKRSRSFGIATTEKKFVDEALKLFEADSARQPYKPGFDRFVISPENSRERLTAFIAGAKRELLIYDPQVGDQTIIDLLEKQAGGGVDVRILGTLDRKKSAIKVEGFPGKRLHVRVIIRDGQRAFLGSQSLRNLELDKRREIGIIVDRLQVVKTMKQTFEDDWALTPTAIKEAEKAKQKAEKNKDKDKDKDERESRDVERASA